jgi:hypothetical protein
MNLNESLPELMISAQHRHTGGYNGLPATCLINTTKICEAQNSDVLIDSSVSRGIGHLKRRASEPSQGFSTVSLYSRGLMGPCFD